ncbi:hypothetical protein OE88DRAFT_1672547 [Heliocybe sulcata]|uniref:Pentacotripeptide-repeat region of PRORP domain-containing protein n=1 Tax=Heliocybe sulcata TaxID=5364 RepID=A0A5C3NCY2_9AGAM|nr:hypothetical protein OE88DRAFT_1672547 [Heliocybe sulcata]
MPKKLLSPPRLARRLQSLCAEGDIDGAVTMLKNMPLDTQTPFVWNTLMQECMRVGRYKLAYKLFTDMKRRGVQPTTKTYDTMLYGLSYIQNWDEWTLLLENAHYLYDNLMKHYELVKQVDPESKELEIDPLASYIRILASIGDYQKIWDIYRALDKDGPLAPNNIIYTAMFTALATRKAIRGQPDWTVPALNAAEARLLWTQMMSHLGGSSEFPADSHTVASVLRCLAYGRAADHLLGMDIAQNVLGLAKPGETPSVPKVALHAQSLGAVLALCNNMRAERTCIHFARQVMNKPRKFHDKSMVDRGHINQVLKAYASLAGSGDATASSEAMQLLDWLMREDLKSGGGAMWPNMQSFNFVLVACQHCKDWQRAIRVFEIMTGYHGPDFLQPSKLPTRRSSRHFYFPHATTMTFMGRCALATGDGVNIRQCLRIVRHMQLGRVIKSSGLSNPEEDSSASKAQLHRYHGPVIELATTVLDMLKALNQERGHKREDIADSWKTLEAEARRLMQGQIAAPLHSSY